VTGVCFVLDEPSTGLHPRDTGRLIETLRNLQATGNSVVVVEHDDAMIEAADHVIEIGPGAQNQRQPDRSVPLRFASHQPTQQGRG